MIAIPMASPVRSGRGAIIGHDRRAHQLSWRRCSCGTGDGISDHCTAYFTTRRGYLAELFPHQRAGHVIGRGWAFVTRWLPLQGLCPSTWSSLGVLFSVLLFSGHVSALAESRIAGRASVIDGDTIEIRGQRIRLFGIDAPESSQLCTVDAKPWRCGQQAAQALDKKISARPVVCIERDRDRYSRVVAVCSVGSESVNAWLVREGWALAYRQYSSDYVADEDDARKARKGIWRGSFVPPWDWRREQRQRGPSK